MSTTCANIEFTWDYKLPGGCLVLEDMGFRCSVEARYEGGEYYDFEFSGIEVSLFNPDVRCGLGEWAWCPFPAEWKDAFERHMATPDMRFRIVEWLNESREAA